MATVRYTVVDGEILAEKRIGIRRCYVPDPLGSTVALLNNGQAITDTFSYRPYGDHRRRTGTTETPFRFGGTLGYYRDVSSGTYVRARYYSPGDGRWQTEDPITNSDINRSRYVLNKPVDFVDPSGEITLIPIIGIAAGGTALVLGGLWIYMTYTCRRANFGPRKTKCPGYVAQAKAEICRRLVQVGLGPLQGVGGVTGSTHYKCMLEWCGKGGGNIYCSDSCTPDKCADSCHQGGQHPDYGILVCLPNSPSGLCSQGICRSPLAESILHELAGICGQHHGPGHGFADACDFRASRMCQVMGL